MFKNYIATLQHELEIIDGEFVPLYINFGYQDLILIFSTLHSKLINLFKCMNERLPSGADGAHFWADPSRSLIDTIDKIQTLQRKLKNTEYAFKIDDYNNEIIVECNKFLNSSGGSTIPPNMGKIDLYYAMPIFILESNIKIISPNKTFNSSLKPIGEGSYAKVYKYFDEFYNRTFVVKQAKKDLSSKEIKRFKQEFETMDVLKSPYVVDVYKYYDNENRYIMEYMDYTLFDYIREKNIYLEIPERKSIVMQVLKAFSYIHSKNMFHRDISPNNILLKIYDDVIVVKIADFGLVKLPDSSLTSVNTEYKGSFNDPCLKLEGFSEYNMSHEVYALTMTIAYIMTGKTNISKLQDGKLKDFIAKGICSEKSKRYISIQDVRSAFCKIY